MFVTALWATGACTAQAAEVLDLDPARSNITFTIGVFGVSHHSGRFGDISGLLTRTAGQPQDDRVMVEVRTASVDCGSAGCNQLVTGPRFFDAARFPTVRFQSLKITRTADKAEVFGDLTLHGVTRPIKLAAKLATSSLGVSESDPVAFTATAVVRRSDFNMSNYRLAVGDTVTLTINAAFAPRLSR